MRLLTSRDPRAAEACACIGTHGMSSAPVFTSPPHPPPPADGCLPVGLSSCFLSLHCLDVNITVQHLLQPLLPSQFLLAHQHIFLVICVSFLSETITVQLPSLYRAPREPHACPSAFAAPPTLLCFFTSGLNPDAPEAPLPVGLHVLPPVARDIVKTVAVSQVLVQ